MRAGAVLTVVLAAVRVFPSATAATPEAVYIAARDAAIAKIKTAVAAEKRGPMDNYGAQILAMDEQARAGLEQQMRAIVGPVAIQDMDDQGALNLDTLIEGDEGFGLLDGMVYGKVDAKTRVIVTTDKMFQLWLHQHKNWLGKDSADLPQRPSAAVKEDAFYTQAVLTDAAIMRFAELPVRKLTGAAFAFAMLAARTQSDIAAQGRRDFYRNSPGRTDVHRLYEKVRCGRADRGVRSHPQRSHQKVGRRRARTGTRRRIAPEEIGRAECEIGIRVFALLR